MIYIIISNIGLALITLVMYIRYSHFRISSSIKVRDLDKSLKATKEEKKKLEENLREELKTETQQVKDLLREIETTKNERQEEIKLRLEAEKQIELAMQKIQEVQARVDDWRMIQDNALKSSKDAIFRFGDDLLHKLSSSHKRETDESRLFIEQNMKDLHKDISSMEGKIEDFKDKISELKVQNAPPVQKNVVVKKEDSTSDDNISDSSTDETSSDEDSSSSTPGGIKMDEVAKKSLSDVVSLIEVSEYKHLKDYVLASKLDANKAKFMLCDLIFIRDKIVYLVDFKADRYFKEYEKLSEKEKEEALEPFKKKIDKYLAYISNPKYKTLIEKLIKALKIEYQELKIVFAVRNRDDLTIMKDLKYYEKAEKKQVEILDVNGVNDLVL